MKYFAEYVFNHIKKQTERNFFQDSSEKKLIIVMPSIPPVAAYHIGLKIEEYSIQTEKLKKPIIKIAKALVSEWESSNNNCEYYCEKIKKNDWNDYKGNLTSYRNISNTEDELLLILLIGIDKIADSSSLADFHHCDFSSIWDDLNNCFNPWIEKKFNDSIIGFEEETIKNFNDILKAILEKGLADILQISQFLENLNLANAQDGKDAEKILMQSLDYFGLPLFVGYDFISSKSFEYYIEKAISFFTYSEFLEERARKKAIKSIEDYFKDRREDIDTYIPSEFYSSFNNIVEFYKGIKDYINTDDSRLRDKLKKCDFVTIDKLIRYKKKGPGNGPRETIKKISGNPIEMILTAIWNTFSDYDIKGFEDIKAINIKTELFKHDSSGNTYKEQHENAKQYIYRLLGGVDDLVEKWIDLKNNNDDRIEIISNLIHDHISYRSARGGEPSLHFVVSIIDDNNEYTIKKKFAWRLPDVHPYRISDEMLQWVNQEVKTIQNHCLPVFHISYFDEMMFAKDEDEVHRVLMQSIEDEKNGIINLLDAITPDINIHADYLEPLHRLAIEYKKYLVKAAQEGIHSFFINGFDDLRQTYEKTFDYFLEKNENNALMCLLFRSFLIIRNQKQQDVKVWGWEPYEKAGIITILHPALLEMLRDQIFYLFACFNYLVSNGLKGSIRNSFRESLWRSYVDLAKIQTPLCGLISDKNMRLDTNVKGNNLVFRIGNISESEASLTTKLLLKYDDFEEDDISDAEIFKLTRESNTYLNILKDYKKLHPHANDALSIAIYQNRDIQPIIAAINQYLKDISKDIDMVQRKYVLAITIFSESGDDSNISRWINQWKECWETSEIQNSLSHYRNSLISISHRIIDSKKDYKQFRNIIHEGFEADLVFLSNFISAGEQGNDFEKVEPYDIRKHTLKFPMLEKSFCNMNNPSKILERARILSNRQFSLSTRFSELMARLKHKETVSGTSHAVLGYGNYSPWQLAIDELHQHSEWVVCIDPIIDESLIRRKAKDVEKSREIIGFGSGVGSHGENNYTISTEQFNFGDILRGLHESIKEVYSIWGDPPEKVAKSILNETKQLSGLSLIKATGTSDYIRDFMAYSLTRKLLKTEEKVVLCDRLISLDAYQHWFETAEDKRRPDLLWIIVRIDNTNKIHLEFRLIECKLAQMSDGHIYKAIEQLRSGLNHLIPLFMPRQINQNTEDDRPDQRYWWLQIHRLISSRTELIQQKVGQVLTALERLSEGDYSIEWQAAAVTYWTDQKNDSMAITSKDEFIYEGKELDINSVAVGSEFVYSLCTSERTEKIPWDEKAIRFDSAIQEEYIKTEKEIRGNESKAKPVFIESNNFDYFKKEKTEQVNEYRVAEDKSSKEDTEKKRNQSIPSRILLGETIRGQKKVYWEYGHQELSNRHMIIFGTSGMGKTYAIQCLLWELGKAGNNSLIVDYTNGFFDNQLEPEIKTLLKPIQHIIQEVPLNINPFRRQMQNIADKTIPENVTTTAQRVSDVFSEVYNFGDQQKSALYQAIKLWLEFNKNKSMGLNDLIPQLRDLQNQKGAVGSSASSVVSRIQPFIDQNPFGKEEQESWEKIYNDLKNNCHIIQLAGFLKTSAQLITEFLLIDLYWYYRWKGNQNNPRVVVLDEIQNLDHREDSPLAQLLTEGRKFGFSLILATQIMSNLNKDERDRLFNAGHKLFFKPVDTEIKRYAEIASVFTNEKTDVWVRRLADLKKGQCYSLGPSLNEATGLLETKAFQINITPLKDRE